MPQPGTPGALAPIKTPLPAVRQRLAENLRELFSGLGISVRRYAARRHLDAGALSRYLNGKRVPPWQFVENLISDLNYGGHAVKPEVEQMLRELHRKAQSLRKGDRQVQELYDRLAEADETARRMEVHKEVLAETLETRQHELSELRRRMRRIEHERESERRSHASALVAWEGEYDELKRQRDDLEEMVHGLRGQLHEVRRDLLEAEEECRRLEGRLVEAEEQLGGAAELETSLLEALETTNRTASVPQLVDLATRLDVVPGRESIVTELVTSASRFRPIEEAVALVQGLCSAQLHRYAEAALPAMVMLRPPTDTASLIGALARIGLEALVVAAIKASLDMHATGDLVTVVAALGRQGLGEQVDALLGAAFTVRPLAEVPDMISALEALGLRQTGETALRDACAANRPVHEIVELMARFRQSGRDVYADLLRYALATARPAGDTAQAVDLFDAHGCLAVDARRIVPLCVRTHTPERLAALITAFHPTRTQPLINASVREWSAPDVASLIVHLHHRDGRRAGALTLVSFFHERGTPELGALVRHLDSAMAEVSNAVLSRVARFRSFTDLAELVRALENDGLLAHATHTFWEGLVYGPSGYAAGLVRELSRTGSHLLSCEYLVGCASRLSVPDLVVLSNALHAGGRPDDTETLLMSSSTERDPDRLIRLLTGLDESGDALADLYLRGLAQRPVPVWEHVDLAEALEYSAIGHRRYRSVFVDAMDTPTRAKVVKGVEIRNEAQLERIRKAALQVARSERVARHKGYAQTAKNIVTLRRRRST
jgi:hypothetical protein